VALDGVSLQAQSGDVVALVGGNGAGKSTLLRTIAGLTPAATGTVEASSRPLLLSVGAALLPELTGRRNAYLGCLAQGMGREEARETAPSVIEFAELGGAIDRPLSSYSSGMSARLRFAIATARQHEILLVDEALSVGDAAFARKSSERLAELASRSGTVFLVSHSMGILTASCNRAVWLDCGQVRLDGDVDQVLGAYRAAS
jgi:teichoic acid transport system ATP-binding protein